MAKAGRKHFGPGVQGKGDGAGAMSEVEDEALRKSQVLSNRDEAARGERGRDGRWVQSEERKDHAADRREGGEAADGE